VRSTLRYQLIAIVAATVATVLVASQWVSLRVISRQLDEDLEDRARLLVRTVADLSESVDAQTLRSHLTVLLRARRQVSVIDVFEIGESLRWLATTRDEMPPPGSVLEAAAVPRLRQKEAVRTILPERDGLIPWRLAIPVERGGRVVKVVQVEMLPSRETGLRRDLYSEQAAFVLVSIVLISMLLAWFLERYVTHPVTTLRRAMVDAQQGNLRARAVVKGDGEFAFLAGGFNEMLAQIERLTTGLQARVEEATRDLAAKNVELHELNEKLDRAQHEAARRQPVAAAGQIASTIAHELGTPLNSILGYTQLLLRQEMAPDQKTKLNIIESQIRRMIETIQGILDRTRRHLVPRTPVEVVPLVDEALAFVSQRIAEAELSVKTEIPSDLSLFQGDAVGLRQILVNLLTNAIDATDPKGTITVRAAVVARENDQASQIEIAVSDTGKGLRSEELERVFEPFYTTKEPGMGTGLGLAIVSQIASDHGGRVFAESEPGRGTTIRVQLPLEI
jgi:two-component system, NtrC family, sensor kinase